MKCTLKRRMLSVFMTLAIMLTLLPLGSMTALAADNQTAGPKITAPTDLAGWYVGFYLQSMEGEGIAETKKAVDEYYESDHLAAAEWTADYQAALEDAIKWQTTTDYIPYGTVAADGTFYGGTDANSYYVAFFFVDHADLVAGANWKIYIANTKGECTLTSDDLYLQGTFGTGLTPTTPTEINDNLALTVTWPEAGTEADANWAGYTGTDTLQTQLFHPTVTGFDTTKMSFAYAAVADMSSGTTATKLESGKTYYAILVFEAADGYVFPERYTGTATVNDAAALNSQSASEACLQGNPAYYGRSNVENCKYLVVRTTVTYDADNHAHCTLLTRKSDVEKITLDDDNMTEETARAILAQDWITPVRGDVVLYAKDSTTGKYIGMVYYPDHNGWSKLLVQDYYDSEKLTSDVPGGKVYVIGTAADLPAYTVQFDGNGGKAYSAEAVLTGSQTLTSQTITASQDLATLTWYYKNPSYVYGYSENKKINGWILYADGSKVTYSDGEEIIYTTSELKKQGLDLDLRAAYQAGDTIALNKVETSSEAITKGFYIGVYAEREGYIFDGWYTSASGSTEPVEIGSADLEGKTLYAHWRQNENDQAKNGWLKEDGSWYYYKDDVAQTGWFTDPSDGKTYYLDPDTGAMLKGWQKVDGKWYYLNNSLQTGVKQINGKWYDLNADAETPVSGWTPEKGSFTYTATTGEMLTGWVKDGGKWYYFGANGARVSGWLKDDGKWYYMNPDADSSNEMLRGWQLIDGKWYYLNNSMKTGWQKISGKWYYLNNSMQTGWQKIDGKWYYLGTNGAMVSSCTMTIDGKSYTFDAHGVWTK